MSLIASRVALCAEVTDPRDSEIGIEAFRVRSHTMFRTSLLHCAVREDHEVVAKMVDASPIEDAEPTYPVELIPGIKVQRQPVRSVGSQLNDGGHNRRVVNYNPTGSDGVVVRDCRHDKQATDEQSTDSQPSHGAFAEILSSGSTDRGWDFVAHVKGSSSAILNGRDSTAWRNVAQGVEITNAFCFRIKLCQSSWYPRSQYAAIAVSTLEI